MPRPAKTGTAKTNGATLGFEATLGREPADTFHHDLHPDLRADYVLANPPFNISDWGGKRLREDQRCGWDTAPWPSLRRSTSAPTPNGTAARR